MRPQLTGRRQTWHAPINQLCTHANIAIGRQVIDTLALGHSAELGEMICLGPDGAISELGTY